MSGEDVSDLYLSRMILEAGVVRRLAARRSLPPRAAATIEAKNALGSGAPPTQYVAPDIEFHAALAAHVGSRRVGQMHAALMQQMQLCMAQVQAHHLLSPGVIVTEHEPVPPAVVQLLAPTNADVAPPALVSANEITVPFAALPKPEPPFVFTCAVNT